MLPSFQRVETLLATLERLHQLRPRAAEIIVHIDGGDLLSGDAVRQHFPDVVVIQSATRVGPGGGRNRMLEAATNPLVVSLDDDSYPLDEDFLLRAVTVMSARPDAALVSCAITHRGESPLPARPVVSRTASFIGCGTVYRKQLVTIAGPYIPLPIAYAMEETDLALRALDNNLAIYASPWLRVFHDTNLEHHADPRINAGVLRNLALHAFLRYPLQNLAYGAGQVLRRVAWSVSHGRYAGIMSGLAGIPKHLWQYKHLRQPVRASTLRKRRALQGAEATTEERFETAEARDCTVRLT